MIKLKIADLIVQLNIPIKILHDNMYKFLYKGAKEADIEWNVIFSNKTDINESVYIESKNYKICKDDSSLIYEYSKGIDLPYRIIVKDNYKNCTFYIPKNYKNIEKNTRNMDIKLKEGLNNAFKEMFILACVFYNKLPIESSSIIYDNKAYLFASSYEINKNEHALLWVKEYGCEILNDTVVIAQLVEETKNVEIYPSPWCEKYINNTNKNITLGGIAFLNKSITNKIYELDKEDVGIRMLESLTIPLIYKEIVDNEVIMINQMSKIIKGYLLECNTDKEAAIVGKNNMVK